MIISKDYWRAPFPEGEQPTLQYLVFALQAEREGYPQIATLFRETVRVARINTPLHFQAPKHYRVAAAKEADQEPPGSRAAAEDQENKHNDPYQKALKRLAEMAKGDYYVCAGCGYIWEKQRPDKCSRCRSKAINFIKVG